MIEYIDCEIKQISAHKIGNRTNDEDLVLSNNPLIINDKNIYELLAKYFLKPFTLLEFYNFTFSNEDINLNPLYNFTNQIFEQNNSFHLSSINIAKHLYEVTNNTNIKSGDLFVVHFTNTILNGVNSEILGIFKSEQKQSFLKLNNNDASFEINSDNGINIDKLDKGCLIINTEKENGYKICIIDKSNKTSEAQYWKDSFLNIKPCNDDYHFTKDFLNITKTFVTKQAPNEFELSKADKIDLLNRSVDYFKTHDSFNKDEFEEKVFSDENMIESFRNFDNLYRLDNEINIDENFDISAQAVKKQEKAFKSVLKLDKNFHIYIHGDKNLIEQGTDKDGRKFYKIYYNKEE